MYEKNKNKTKIDVRAVKAYISKSILPTYVRFSHGRSHMLNFENVACSIHGSDSFYALLHFC